MHDAILVINAGSSSLKFALFPATADETPILKGKVAGIGRAPELSGKGINPDALGPLDPALVHEQVVHRLLTWLSERPEVGDIIAVGHRVVHGGTTFADPVLLTPTMITALEDLSPLAPSHQPHNLAAVRAIASWKPDLPQVACFDTGFHQTQPEVTRRFALPRDLSEAGVIRYGFHGLSYDYISQTMADDPELAGYKRVIVAHLGNGASMCAMKDGNSVATTMGFSALDGLMMGRRCGAIDPGVLLYLQKTKGMSVSDVETLLYKQSGLLGVSGVSNAMQVLETSDAPDAALAIEMFCYRAASQLAGLIPAIGGVEAIIFTAGIGENSAKVRAGICSNLDWMGINLDDDSNRANARKINSNTTGPAIFVIPTNEEATILRDTRNLI
jgi:acetate kinase